MSSIKDVFDILTQPIKVRDVRTGRTEKKKGVPLTKREEKIGFATMEGLGAGLAVGSVVGGLGGGLVGAPLGAIGGNIAARKRYKKRGRPRKVKIPTLKKLFMTREDQVKYRKKSFTGRSHCTGIDVHNCVWR